MRMDRELGSQVVAVLARLLRFYLHLRCFGKLTVCYLRLCSVMFCRVHTQKVDLYSCDIFKILKSLIIRCGPTLVDDIYSNKHDNYYSIRVAVAFIPYFYSLVSKEINEIQ